MIFKNLIIDDLILFALILFFSLLSVVTFECLIYVHIQIYSVYRQRVCSFIFLSLSLFLLSELCLKPSADLVHIGVDFDNKTRAK